LHINLQEYGNTTTGFLTYFSKLSDTLCPLHIPTFGRRLYRSLGVGAVVLTPIFIRIIVLFFLSKYYQPIWSLLSRIKSI